MTRFDWLCMAIAFSAGCGSEHGDSSHPRPELTVATAPHHAHEHHHPGAEGATAAGRPIAGSSVFQIDSEWTDQRGASLKLSALRGKPTVVLMFYGSCTTMCPVLLHDVVRLDEALNASTRASVQYLLVTLDPARDTSDRLRALATEYSLDTSRFRLVSAPDSNTRELANVLGVQYRRVGTDEIAHSAVINLLDAEGVYVDQVVGLGQPVDALARRIDALVAQGR